MGSQSGSIPVGASFQNTVSNTALSPDGLPNYGLRSVPQYTAGVNTPSSIINTNDTRLLARGFDIGLLDPYHTESRVQDWNLTFEKEIMDNTIIRIAYIGNHGDHQQQEVHYNDATPDYVWYQTTKTPLPMRRIRRRGHPAVRQTGLREHHALYQLGLRQLQRRSVRMGTALQQGLLLSDLLERRQYLPAEPGHRRYPDQRCDGEHQHVPPGTVPTDFDARNRFLNYKRDSNTPKHQIRWNFIAELPLGKGKKFLGNSRGVVDKLVGGWQVAGLGNMRQGLLATSDRRLLYPTGTPIETYGYKYPIQDCQSGTCYPGYLWWNGYIPANKINSVDANGKPNGIMGVPANYKPATAPLIPQGQTALPPNAPAGTVVSQFWDTNTVWVPLSNGTAQRDRLITTT